MNNHVKLFLISLLCLSASFFVIGVNLVSYADERVKERIDIIEDDSSRDDIDYGVVSRVDYRDLPRRQTRAVSEFPYYFNNFAFSDLEGGYFISPFATINSYSLAVSYARTITGNSSGYFTTDIDFTQSFKLLCQITRNTWPGGNTVRSLVIDSLRFSYTHNNTYGYNVISVSVVSSTNVGTGNSENNFILFRYYSSLSGGNTNTNSPLNTAKFTIVDISGTAVPNNFFSIDAGDSYYACFLYYVQPTMILNDGVFSFNFHDMQFYNSVPLNVIRSISVVPYVANSSNTEFPLDIPIGYTQTIPLDSSNYDDTTGTYSFSENLLTFAHGTGYVLYFSVNTQYGSSSVVNYYSASTLPFIYDYGESPVVTLSVPIIILSNNMIEWSPVNNADYYVIKRVTDGQTYYVNNYTTTSYVVSINGVYSVQACSYSDSFLPSDYSNTITIDYFADNQYSFLLLISVIMDSILMLFKSFLNYEVLGVNMFGAFGVILFILLILAILKFIRSK